MSRRAPNIGPSNLQATAYSLALLGEYTHTLDSLPLDLSRCFADLRELDAVLSSSMSLLTTKITELTIMLENNTESKEKRLWLLTQIAEEAARLKLGGEDKIRVACQAADGLRGHKSHMKTLIQQVPDQDFESIDSLGRKTVFPHVAKRSYMPLGGAGEGGRRQRRGAYGSLLSSSAVDASPNKRKRHAARDEELDVKTPRKEKTGDAARQRNTARSKRPDRAASPTESLLSVASHLPPSAQQGHGNATNSRPNITRANGSSNNKRARTIHNAGDPAHADPTHPSVYNAPPSSSVAHPSLPIPYVNGLRTPNGGSEWTPGQLEGPGMPVARTFPSPAATDAREDAANASGEVDGEADDTRTYCFCERVSFGDMVACDDVHCEREWFHLPCVGLSIPPAGTWFCEVCLAKRQARRTGRGGKKRAGGGRSAARNTSA